MTMLNGLQSANFLFIDMMMQTLGVRFCTKNAHAQSKKKADRLHLLNPTLNRIWQLSLPNSEEQVLLLLQTLDQVTAQQSSNN